MMLRPTHPARAGGDRRGAILIVVLALLAIFAVVALTFVFYSGAEADAARIYKQGQNAGDGTPNPADAVNAFLSAVVFDAGDGVTNPADLMNAMRGHSLARTMYGYNSANMSMNLVPFNGVGTFHGTPAPGGLDRAYVANHTLIGGGVVDPEWTQPRVSSPNQLATSPASIAGNVYIPKNAAYTYVDANNMALASVSPQTGEVLVPSYYRPWQFRHPSQPATATGLEPSNPNWTTASNAPERFRILRPRPQDNVYAGTSEFPYVPQNADTTYTGDVMNLPGGYNFTSPNYNARNDSIWMDIGLPPRLWNGKWVKPLVAALIIDKDGCVNLSANGHNLSGSLSSFAGYGPWEVNPNAVLNNPAETSALIAARQNGGPAQSRGGATSRNYAYTSATNQPYSLASSYSGVNWTATSTPLIQLPGNGAPYIATTPTYTGYQMNNPPPPPAVIGHPSLFNPNEWTSAGGPRTFRSSDLSRLSGRFAGDLDFYQQTDLARLASPPNASLLSSSSRTDVAHPNRLSITPFSATLDVPGFMPTTVPASSPTMGIRFPTGTTGSYSAGATSVGLGPVNLNRPLADYRTTLTTALSSPGNVTAGQAQLAQTDRQQLAHDIFARLVMSTTGGFSPVANGYSNGSVMIYTAKTATYQIGDVQLIGITASTAMTPNAQFEALRYLAQMSANIVDYIDNDDVSTAFVWNPVTPGPAASVVADPANFTPGTMANNTVFGMEKPRLVINEVYSEMANDPSEPTAGAMMKTPPSLPLRVRFWVELLNPSTANAAPFGALGDGSVALAPGGFQPYRIQVTKNGGAAFNNLQSRLNANGDMTVGPPPVVPEIQFDFSRTVAAAPNVSPNGGVYGPNLTPGGGCVVVGPNVPAAAMGSGPQPFEFNPAAGAMGPPWNNMVQSAPMAMPTDTNYMEYQTPLPMTEASLADGTYNTRHLVALQRLSNPYLPLGPTNPYITVDYMDYVIPFDSVNRTAAEMGTGRPPKMVAMGAPPSGTGYDPTGYRFSIGKVQPYAGYAYVAPGSLPAAGNTSTLQPSIYSFTTTPKSFVLAQQPNGFVQGTSAVPATTFWQHNGKSTTTAPNAAVSPPNDTLLTPYEWVVHFDRPLVNQLELLQVTGVPTHNLTQTYISAPTGTVYKASTNNSLAIAPWLGSDGTGNLPTYQGSPPYTNNGLFRSFDLLRVKPWGFGVPMGGKVHGKININTVQDPRVLYALFDPQGSNTFGGLMQPNVPWNTWFNGLMSRRTSNFVQKYTASGSMNDANGFPLLVPTPGPTNDDIPGSPDRPFKPFGVGEYSGGQIAATGLDDTILRTNGIAGATPLLFDPNTASHPYLRAEAARKILNNTTTVSNSFVAFYTVGYFEVRTDGNGNPVFAVEGPSTSPNFNTITAAPAATDYARPILGREAFRDVPGDLRQKFFTVIDRNNLTINGAGTAVGPRPAFSTLEANPPAPPANTILIAAGTDPATGKPAIFGDGYATVLQPGSVLFIGDGIEQEQVQVLTASAPANGVSTVTLTGAMQFYHPPGSSVTNVTSNPAIVGVARFGNPGPQAVDVFNPNDPAVQSGVIRDFGAVR